jgi:MSHA biogenesis protein MshJ
MKAWWTVQAARINALSLRERVFLFLSVLAVLLALADVLWLSPAQTTHKQLKQSFERQSAELKSALTAVKALARPIDDGQEEHNEISLVKARQEAVRQDIKTVLPDAGNATPLAQVLTQLLRRHEGLTLVHIAALAPELASDVVPAPAGRPAVPGAVVTRQGVEMTVAGPYMDLIRFVQTLENSLPQVRWGVMSLKKDKQDSELSLQLFLLGLKP